MWGGAWRNEMRSHITEIALAATLATALISATSALAQHGQTRLALAAGHELVWPTDVRSANNNWCAIYTKPENENCTFATFEQCQATVWRVGGWCRPDPFPNTAFGTGWSWSKPPRQSRGGR